MPLLVRRALTLFVAPSVCSSAALCAALGLDCTTAVGCYAVAPMAWLQERFSNNLVAGQRCVARLLAPCWLQRSACVAISGLQAELLNRGFSRYPGRVAEASQGVAHLCSLLLAHFLSEPSSRSLPLASWALWLLVAAMDAVLLLRAARPWLTARDQRAARTTTPAVNAGDAQ